MFSGAGSAVKGILHRKRDGSLESRRKTRDCKLSRRLQAVAAMVTKGNVVCDVGCDHGFIPIYLVQNGISPKVIAMDINEGPLAAAKEHIGEYFLAGYIETRLSDGLAALRRGEAGTVICAGMGGRLVIRILEEGRGKLGGAEEIILQPQSELQNVRAYLRGRGYVIADEDMVFEDGRYYPMMRVCYGSGSVTAAAAGSGKSGAAGNVTAAAASGKKDASDGGKNGAAGVDGCRAGILEAGRQDVVSGKRQEIEDKYGPVLLRRAHPVLRAYLEREAGICGQILANLRESGRGQEARIGEVTGKLEDVRAALSYFSSEREDLWIMERE